MKWTSPNDIAPDRDKDYAAMVTYLPITSCLKMPAFFSHAVRIQKQLNKAKGLVGYMLRADVITKKSYTLSVWEDKNSLYEFVRSGMHKKVMSEDPDYLREDRKFVETEIKGIEIPPDWEWAMWVLEEK